MKVNEATADLPCAINDRAQTDHRISTYVFCPTWRLTNATSRNPVHVASVIAPDVGCSFGAIATAFVGGTGA
jgi:hypothetical protein